MADTASQQPWFVSLENYLLQRHPNLFSDPSRVHETVHTALSQMACSGALDDILHRLCIRTCDTETTQLLDSLVSQLGLQKPADIPKPEKQKTLHALVKEGLAPRTDYQGKKLDNQACALARNYLADSTIIPAVEIKGLGRARRITIKDYSVVETRVIQLLDGDSINHFQLKDLVRHVLTEKKPEWTSNRLAYELDEPSGLYHKFRADSVLLKSVKITGKSRGTKYNVVDYWSAKERIEALVDGAEIQPLLQKKTGKRETRPKEERDSYVSVLRPLIEEKYRLKGEPLDKKQLSARTAYLARKYYDDWIVQQTTESRGSGKGRKVYVTKMDDLSQRLMELVEGAEIETIEPEKGKDQQDIVPGPKPPTPELEKRVEQGPTPQPTPPVPQEVYDLRGLKISSTATYSPIRVTEILLRAHDGYFTQPVIDKVIKITGCNGAKLIDILKRHEGMMLLSGSTKAKMQSTLDVDAGTVERLLGSPAAYKYIRTTSEISDLPFLLGREYNALLAAMHKELVGSAAKKPLTDEQSEYRQLLSQKLNGPSTETQYTSLVEAGVLSTKSPEAEQRTHEALVERLYSTGFDLSVDIEALREERGIDHFDPTHGILKTLLDRKRVVDVVAMMGITHTDVHVYAVAAGKKKEIYHAFGLDGDEPEHPSKIRKGLGVQSIYIDRGALAR